MDCGGAYCSIFYRADFYISRLGIGCAGAHPQRSYRARFNQKICYASPRFARFQQFGFKTSGSRICQRGGSGFRLAPVALGRLYRARGTRYPRVD